MSARRPWATVLAALLLLVPLALRAHVHVAHPSTDCVVCAVSLHAPAVRATAPAVAIPRPLTGPIEVVVLAPALSGSEPVHVGRGPPALLRGTVRG